MKKTLALLKIYGLILSLSVVIFSCKKEETKQELAQNISPETKTEKTKKQPVSSEFKSYWYAGEAEISSYKLEQARYGEIRQGTAVLVYVTEDFLPNVQVKANNRSNTTIPVLKLNATKNFNTGIYPYSIMESTFYPIANDGHAVKTSCSIQEWCGHFYAQINNRDNFEVLSHSYFEGEADQQLTLSKAILENELWTQLRINPQSLPTGDLEIVPDVAYTRLLHKPIKAFKATAVLNTDNYAITYPELERTLIISFNSEFPFEILGWEETFKSGFGANAKILTSKATKLKTIKSAYWAKNSNADEILRESLELDQ